MEELYVEGLATHGDPEPCVDVPRGRGEALVGARAGRAIEPRNGAFGVPTLSKRRKATLSAALSRVVGGPRVVREPGHVRNLHAREPGLRHEALLCSDGGERPPSLGRRSGRVKLEAAGTGGCRGRWEQPRQSRVGPVLPDGSGPVSETGRSTRETGVVTPLDLAPALTRWMWAGLRCVSARHDGWRTPDRVFPAWVGRPRRKSTA
jgi:hypothetical protein